MRIVHKKYLSTYPINETTVKKLAVFFLSDPQLCYKPFTIYYVNICLSMIKDELVLSEAYCWKISIVKVRHN